MGSVHPVVTVAMVQELRDNRRGICGRAREGVAAAILMAATQEAMQVEMFEVGGGSGQCGGGQWRKDGLGGRRLRPP